MTQPIPPDWPTPADADEQANADLDRALDEWLRKHQPTQAAQR